MSASLLKIFGNRDLVCKISAFLSCDDLMRLFWAYPLTRIERTHWAKDNLKHGRMMVLFKRDDRFISLPYTNLCDVAHFLHRSNHTAFFLDAQTGQQELVLHNGRFYFCHIVETLRDAPIGFAVIRV